MCDMRLTARLCWLGFLACRPMDVWPVCSPIIAALYAGEHEGCHALQVR